MSCFFFGWFLISLCYQVSNLLRWPSSLNYPAWSFHQSLSYHPIFLFPPWHFFTVWHFSYSSLCWLSFLLPLFLDWKYIPLYIRTFVLFTSTSLVSQMVAGQEIHWFQEETNEVHCSLGISLTFTPWRQMPSLPACWLGPPRCFPLKLHWALPLAPCRRAAYHPTASYMVPSLSYSSFLSAVRRSLFDFQLPAFLLASFSVSFLCPFGAERTWVGAPSVSLATPHHL